MQYATAQVKAICNSPNDFRNNSVALGERRVPEMKPPHRLDIGEAVEFGDGNHRAVATPIYAGTP